MKYGLTLALVFIGVWSIPAAIDFTQTDSVSAEKLSADTEGEVKGVQSNPDDNYHNELAFQAESIAPTPIPTPAPTSAAMPTPAPASIMNPTPILTPSPMPLSSWEILAEPLMIKNETKTFALPSFSSTTPYLLEIDYELSSSETNLGFDEPALMIFIDEKLAYQQSPLEDKERKKSSIKFNPRIFSDSPQKLQIWSGDQLDDTNQSFTLVTFIQLVPLREPIFIETAMIQDFQATADTENLVTLSWKTPVTTDPFLLKPLAYEIRYSLQPITIDTWPEATLAKIIQPQFFAPKAADQEELALIQLERTQPERNTTTTTTTTNTDLYFAIRSIDSLGELSPLSQTKILISSY